MKTTKLILWLLLLIIIVLIGIEIIYREGECCDCTKYVDVACDGGNVCKAERKYKEGCCKCSFFKERFGIDLYSWRDNK